MLGIYSSEFCEIRWQKKIHCWHFFSLHNTYFMELPTIEISEKKD